MKFTIQYNAGNPNMCRIPELIIHPVPECEGGGYWIPKQQAEALINRFNDGVLAAVDWHKKNAIVCREWAKEHPTVRDDNLREAVKHEIAAEHIEKLIDRIPSPADWADTKAEEIVSLYENKPELKAEIAQALREALFKTSPE